MLLLIVVVVVVVVIVAIIGTMPLSLACVPKPKYSCLESTKILL